MNTCTLNVLHDSGDKVVSTVANSIYLDFLAHHVLIDKHRIFKSGSGDDLHVLDDILIGVSDYHVLTAENVGRTHKNGIAQILSSLKSFLGVHNGMTCGTGYSALVEQLIKTLSVLSSINAVCRGSEYPYAHIGKVLCKLDSCLSAELNNNTVRLFSLNDRLNVLLGKRIEIKSVSCVKVGRNSLRVIVADNCIVAHFLERPYAVNGAVVELDTLTYSDRTRTENYDLLLACISAVNELSCLVLLVICGVEVGSFSLELACAGINHLEYGSCSLGTLLTAHALNGAVKITVLLGKVIFFTGKLAVCKISFQISKVFKLGEEPHINLCDIMYLFKGNSPLDSLEHNKGTFIIYVLYLVVYLLIGKLFKLFEVHGIKSQLNRTYSLHHSLLERGSYSHDLTCCHHLSAESTLCVNEFIERPLGELYNNIVKSRLEASVCLACYCIDYLVESVANGNSCCNLCNRISCCLGSQCGRTGNSGVYLDHRIFERCGVKRKLAVAAALYLKLGNNVQSRSSEHLIFLIGKSYRRSDYYGVTCVNANGVKVFHGADCDNITLAVTDNLEFDLLPAAYALFNKYLGDRRKSQSVCCDINKLFLVICDTAACAAQCECGTDDNGIVNDLCKVNSVLNCLNYL